MPPSFHSLAKIIHHCGITNVAASTGVSVRAVYKWAAKGRLPRTEFTGETEYAAAISQLSRGAFTPDDVRAAGRPAVTTTAAA